MNPASFFHKPELVTLQLIPDRTVRNHNTDDLARALAELYRDPLAGFSRDGYRPPEHFAFDITLGEVVRFYLTVPAKWEEYARTRVASLWPRATIKPSDIALPGGTPAAARVCFKNADLYSLHTARSDNRPLGSLLEASKDLRAGEWVRVQLIARPGDRQQWEHEAMQAYLAHRRGQPPERQTLSVGAAVRSGLKVADSVLAEVYDFATEMLCMETTKKQQDNFLFTDKYAKLALQNRAQLTEATIRKMREPIFSTEIRVLAAGADVDHSRLLCRTIGGALNELASIDQELIVRPVPPKLASDVQAFAFPVLNLNKMTLSASELGKFLQLPGAELQQDYPQIEQVSTRETDLPAALTDPAGLHLGTVRRQGQDFPVHLPKTNIDDLCLPYIVIGPMGCGKTRGWLANLAYQVAKAGGVALVVDPAKGEIYEELAAVLPPEQLIRFRFGSEAYGIDWRECMHGNQARNRMANALIAFYEAAGDIDTGPQTDRFLRSAAKCVPGGKLKEVKRLLLDPGYRDKLIKSMPEREREIWYEYGGYSDNRQMQIAAPVLNRINVIDGDDYLADCMDADEGIDIVSLMDEKPGRVIVFDINPADVGSRQAVNTIASLLATKIDLAMPIRKSGWPVFVLQDEPHQYMRAGKTWGNCVVEGRKHRMSFCWAFHGWQQIPPALREHIQNAGPHYVVYGGCAPHTFKDLQTELSPWTLEEFVKVPKHHALLSLYFCGGRIPVFMAKMAPPPSLK